MGTIAQKLEYLNDTRLLLKDNINKINNVLTDNSTFRSYPQELFNGYLDILNNGTDTLWNNLEKVSQTGTEATLEGVETAPIKMVLNGNTSQDTTSGKNLLDTNNISYSSTSTSLTINSNENGEITINGEHFANVTLKSSLSTPLSGTYTLIFKKISGNISNNNINFRYAIGNAGNGSAASPNGRLLTNIFNGDSNIVVSTGNINDTMEKFHIYFNAGATFNNYKFVIYLVQGTYTSENIPDYEPYTGGQPSPSPDYPQEVKVVKGENVVSVQGKNLLGLTNGTYSHNGITAVVNDETITITGTATANSFVNIPLIKDIVLSNEQVTVSISNATTISDTATEFRVYESGNNYIPVQFTTIDRKTTITKTGTFVSAYVRTTSGVSYGSGLVIKPQLELGSTATPYVPYSKTDYPISLGTLELCKIGDYQDYLYKNNGKWYVHKEIGKVVFDGSENFTIFSSNTSRVVFLINISGDIVNYVDATKVPNLICSHFVAITQNKTWANGDISRHTANQKGLYFTTKADETIDTFKNWLSSNNVSVYYPLATPTEEEITNSTLIEQLEAISKAKSVKDKTYITQTNEELPFILDVEAIKEYEVN